MGEPRVALALDEGPILRRHPLVLGSADLIHRVGQVAQDVELVEQNLGLRRMGLHRVAERLPHVHHGQSNPGSLREAQRGKKAIQIGFGPARPADPDGTPAFQVADHDAIRVPLLDGQFIDANNLRGWLRRLGQPRPHVLGIHVFDRMLVQVQHLRDGLVRHVPAQSPDLMSNPVGIAQADSIACSGTGFIIVLFSANGTEALFSHNCRRISNHASVSAKKNCDIAH